MAELAMPMSGRPISSRVRPRAESSERCGAFSRPWVILPLRAVIFLVAVMSYSEVPSIYQKQHFLKR